MNLILGAGLAGLSAAWHLHHHDCVILEKSDVIGGHARSIIADGFTLDHGPHISFTRHDYVRDLFARNVDDAFHEMPISVANFYRGSVVEHPAQVHLWQLPQPLRAACADDMKAAAAARLESDLCTPRPPDNYLEWLRRSFGRAFADALPAAYTRKYWTVGPEEMSVDWLGPRMHTPSLAEVEASLVPGSRNKGYYITTGRYPQTGGFQHFFERFADGAHIRLNSAVAQIDLAKKTATIVTGETLPFRRLISTLPLPDFVRLCSDVPTDVSAAVEQLDCTQLLLIDVFAPRFSHHDYRWFYVYDEDKASTRIHCVENMAPANAPAGMSCVQVEVYSSRHRPLGEPPESTAVRVANELVELGFISAADLEKGLVRIATRSCPFANIVFTKPRRSALDTIFRWLEDHGLSREPDDLDATTDWGADPASPVGSIVMAGRFAQWKYFWTDDCVLRGRQIATTSAGRN